MLVWLFDHRRCKAPISYELLAVQLDMGFEEGEDQLAQSQLERLNVPFYIEKTDCGSQALLAEDGKNGCFPCARKRRKRLFDLAREKDFTKLALGHHQEDIIRDFFT